VLSLNFKYSFCNFDKKQQLKKMIMKKKLLFLLLAVFVVGFMSCEKDEDPDYVGKWTSTATEGEMTLKDVLTLTEDTFEDIISVEVLTDIWVEFMGVKGTMKVAGNSVKLMANSVGAVDDENMDTELVWYDSGTDDFNELVEVFGGTELSGEYEVNGNELTLKTDLNNDGVYSEDEITTYTRM
jgi:hypothetical protein